MLRKVEKVALLKSLSEHKLPYDYHSVIENSKKFAEVIDYSPATEIIADSIHFFHYEIFRNETKRVQRKRFLTIKEQYGISGDALPQKMTEYICPVVLQAMKERAVEIAQSREDGIKFPLQTKNLIKQYFETFRVHAREINKKLG